MVNEDAVDVFLTAIEEAHDALEFDRAMTGEDGRTFAQAMAESNNHNDAFEARVLGPFYREPSALEALRGRQALDRLIAKFPDIWEAAEQETMVDA